MTIPTLRSIQLDDGTIINVQVNPTTNDTTSVPTPSPAPIDPDLDDIETPRSSFPIDDANDDEEYDEDEDFRGPRIPKGWKSSQQSRLPDPPVQPPAPSQGVGTLVKAYTQQLIKDIRSTATSEVEIKKVTLEFGVSLDTELNAYIASTSLNSSVKVAIECALTPPPAP